LNLNKYYNVNPLELGQAPKVVIEILKSSGSMESNSIDFGAIAF